MKLAFVDTPEAVVQAQVSGDDRIVTDNPLLAQHFQCSMVVNIDAGADQTIVNHFGKLAIDLAQTIDDELRTTEAPHVIGINSSHLELSGTLCRYLASFFHRTIILALELRKTQPASLTFRVVASPIVTAQHPLLWPRFSCPHIALIPTEFFGSTKVGVQHVGYAPVTRTTGDVPRNIRRFVHRTGSEIAYEVAIRSRLDRLIPKRSTIAVTGRNEALGESLPWLALRGFKFRWIDFDDSAGISAAADQAEASLQPLAVSVVKKALSHYRQELSFFDDHEIEGIGIVIGQYIARALAVLVELRPRVESRIAQIAAEVGRPSVILTNGLFGPVGAIIYGLLRGHGFEVIGFEHGVTTGISAHSQAKINFSEVSTCDTLMVCAESAVKGFAEAKCSSRVRIEEIGLADQTRKLFRPRLQRFLARRSLGIASKTQTLMHVSAWPYVGNMRPGFGCPTDTWIYNTDKSLICEVYKRIPYQVLFKEYPTRRFAWQPNYREIFPPSSNVAIMPPEDFRYVRAAADILVTSTPTSTFGWLVGVGVPIVWLDSKMVYPLMTDEQREEFRASFLYLDLDQEEWRKELVALLSRPLDEIQADWEERYKERSKLYAKSITGQAGRCGQRAAEIIADIYRRPKLAISGEFKLPEMSTEDGK